MTPILLKHSNQIYIPEARTPDILKIPIRCTFWKHDPQTSETFQSDIHSGSSNPGHSELFLSDTHSGSSNPGYSESLHQFHNNDASQMHLSVNSPKSICRRVTHYNIC